MSDPFAFECVWSTPLPAKAGRFALSPDGEILAVPGRDGSIRLLSVRDGQVLAVRSAAHRREIIAAAWSANGSLLATGAYPGEVGIWRPDLSPVVALGGLPREVNTLEFAGVRRLVAATESGLSQIALPAGDILPGASGSANHLVCTGDGGVIAGTEGGLLQVRGAAMELRRSWPAHAAPICQVVRCDNGDCITVGKDRMVVRWRATTPVARWRRELGGELLAAALAPDEAVLAVRGRDDRVHLLDPRDGQALHAHVEPATERGWCVGLQFLPGLADPWLLLGLAEEDRCIRAWCVRRGADRAAWSEWVSA
ncbi:MAG: WD40 repeat domain-containing protein [Planctomycetes bacterium]|nr:WD40 repeat domain-containing protein [Planctomycetota bacterium]